MLSVKRSLALCSEVFIVLFEFKLSNCICVWILLFLHFTSSNSAIDNEIIPSNALNMPNRALNPTYAGRAVCCAVATFLASSAFRSSSSYAYIQWSPHSQNYAYRNREGAHGVQLIATNGLLEVGFWRLCCRSLQVQRRR